MATKPPLELSVEITHADGSQTRWDAGKPADSIPQGIGFRTRRGDGFADGDLTLPRRIDRDYVDMNLFDGVVISGSDGSVAYEGRVAGLPRSLSQTHSITVQTAGYMAHTRDRKMVEIYVDRDMSHWQQPGITRQAALVTANTKLGSSAVSPDQGGNSALQQTFTGPWSINQHDERYYDAGSGNLIGALYYDFLPTSNVNPADTNWNWNVAVSTDDVLTATSASANLRAATGNAFFTPTTTGRFGVVTVVYNGTTASEGDYSIFWRNLTVYGDHGLTRIGSPGGITASDAIRHLIGKYCPLLNTNGVQTTTYPIPHLVFRDRIDPYDALLEINKYHLWQLGVYENRTLYFNPVDMNDYDWDVRASDPGVTWDAQGDSTEDLANGIVVTYTDVNKGTVHVLTPLEHTELADTSPDNPANTHGLARWTEISLSTPTNQDGALQIGRTALAEYNQAKAPGTISVQGHIRDREGHFHPVWKVRAGDRIAITDHANDRPRLVAETSYSHDSKTIQISVDQGFKRLDAILDRIAGAVAAAGLS